MSPMMSTALTRDAKIEIPLICGAMYPCSNPELVASVSEAGGLGIVQPVSLVYVWGHEFRAGLRHIKQLTSKPIGMNALIEKSSKMYHQRMMGWVEAALDEGVRFFITALGNPKEVVRLVKSAGGIVYHDVTERKWAEKALEMGADGLICVNNRAGGHAGRLSPEELYRSLSELKVPLVCAGGVGDEAAFKAALQLGYAGVQMGTRFIATKECRAHDDYKNAILRAEENDIVHTERVTGVPLAVIRTPHVDKVGTKVGPIGRFLLKNPRTKYMARGFYNLNSAWRMRRSVHKGFSTKDYWQAGKSVAGIHEVESAQDIVRRFAAAL